MPFARMSYPIKVTLLGATVSIALIGVLAMYFKRKRKRPKPRQPRQPIVQKELARDTVDYSRSSVSSMNSERRWNKRIVRSPTNQSKLPNGDLTPSQRSVSPASQRMPRSGSQSSLHSDSMMSSSTLTMQATDTANLTPEQLCDLGLENLQVAIQHWEDAVEQIDELTDRENYNPGLEQLQDQLHQLIGRACHIRNQYEQRLIRQVSTTAALDAALQQLDTDYDERRAIRNASVDGSVSDQESFVSAIDFADLSDLEDHMGNFQHLALYEAALLELQHGSIPCRSLRTKMVECHSDTEFIAKLHCIRLAFQMLFKDASVMEWFAASGKEIISALLLRSDREVEDFEIAYDEMIEYASDLEHWKTIEEELNGRGVKVMNFYDIVLDFILFDAFDDLDNPPSSVITVVQNRWLSNGFKETALSTAVWSVLKAKRRLLRFPDAFIGHFYAISEHMSPVLAWGFLGPPGNLKDLCLFFKQQVLGFVKDSFNFDRVCYTTVELLADDLLRLARERAAVTSSHLSS